jgi:hypothetical protein
MSLRLIDLRKVALRGDPAYGQALPRPAWYRRPAFLLVIVVAVILTGLVVLVAIS